MFLPTTLKEVRARGWDQLDVILFTGDAYIDHPSFGAAVIGRLLENAGYRVAVLYHSNAKAAAELEKQLPGSEFIRHNLRYTNSKSNEH